MGERCPCFWCHQRRRAPRAVSSLSALSLVTGITSPAGAWSVCVFSFHWHVADLQCFVSFRCAAK